ncbi:unnamed protein product [Spirodela intermedia]|uniref:Uncharacterized protein n=1 Tax=Spirodela intermedia TaxID=51605 RepID=A0A7I8KTX2_SPIIN|nr:unnamed protein product [Spirodela intermedia]
MAICTPSPPPFMARATLDIRSPMEFPQASTVSPRIAGSTPKMAPRATRRATSSLAMIIASRRGAKRALATAYRRGRLSGISIQWRSFEEEQEGFSPPEFSLQPQRGLGQQRGHHVQLQPSGVLPQELVGRDGEGVDQVEGDEEDGSPDGDLPRGEDEGEGQQRQEEEDDVPDEAPPVDLDPLLRHADGDDAHHHAGYEDGTAENAVHADIAGA